MGTSCNLSAYDRTPKRVVATSVIVVMVLVDRRTATDASQPRTHLTDIPACDVADKAYLLVGRLAPSPQHGHNGFFKRWQIMAHDLPNNLQIKTEIVVGQAVSHPSNRRPWDICG